MSRAELGPVLVTGGGGFLGTAVIKLLRERGLAVRSLARRFLPAFGAAWGRANPGRRRRSASCRQAVEAARPSSTPRPRRASGARHEITRGSTCSGTQNVIEACRASGVDTNHLHQLAQRGLQRHGHGGSGRVGSVFEEIRGRLPADQGTRRADGPRGQQQHAGHAFAAAAPDLGPGRQQLCCRGSSLAPDAGGSGGSGAATRSSIRSTSTTPPRRTCWPPIGSSPARRLPDGRTSSLRERRSRSGT